MYFYYTSILACDCSVWLLGEYFISSGVPTGSFLGPLLFNLSRGTVMFTCLHPCVRTRQTDAITGAEAESLEISVADLIFQSLL